MSFFIYDITFLVIFSLFLALFLIKRRRKLKREGILILYRTKVGIRIINYISKKYEKFLHKFEYVLVFTGYALMAGMLYLLFQLVYIFLKSPDFIRAVKIPPIAPLIPYFPQIFKVDYLPAFYFTYWIIVLAIAAITHEFLHGIFAKARQVKIKSTGFAFLGPFLAFFVEPDENKVKKIKAKEQIAFLNAGSFANLFMAIFFFIVMWLFFLALFNPAGVIFNTYTYSFVNTTDIKVTDEKFFINFDSGLNLTKVLIGNKTYYAKNDDLEKKGLIAVYEDAPALKAGLAGVIVEFEGKEILTNADLKRELELKKPGDEVAIKTLLDSSIKEYKIKLIERPDNKEAYLGIALIRTEGLSFLGKIRSKILFFKDPNTYYKPRIFENLMVFIYNLFWWIVLVNFSVALVNMLPLGIFDGGRVFYVSMLAITKSENIAKKLYKLSTYLLLFVFLLLTVLWFVNFPL